MSNQMSVPTFLREHHLQLLPVILLIATEWPLPEPAALHNTSSGSGSIEFSVYCKHYVISTGPQRAREYSEHQRPDAVSRARNAG